MPFEEKCLRYACCSFIISSIVFCDAFGMPKQTGSGENSGELLSECRRCKVLRHMPMKVIGEDPNLSGKRTEDN